MELRELLNDDELLNRAAIEEAPPEVRYLSQREQNDLLLRQAGEGGGPGGAAGTGATAGATGPSTTLATTDFATAGQPAEPTAEPQPEAGAGASSGNRTILPGSLVAVALPYAQLEVIFNHQNLYASKQQHEEQGWRPGGGSQPKPLDPALLTYDLEDGTAWEPFLTPRMRKEGKPACFYQPRRVSTKVPKDRLSTMEQQIEGEIKSQLVMARGALPTSVNTMRELVSQLDKALEFRETIKCNPANAIGEQARKDFDFWGRAVKDKTPPKSSFKGRAINYAYTDAKKIRKHLFTTCDFASSLETDLIYLVACRCFPYFGGVVSVWVYFAVIDRSGQEESAKMAEESRAVASVPL